MTGILMFISSLFDAYSVPIIAGLQASFCGGCAWQIAFKFRRNGSTYQLLPSLCAFGLASLFAQQWLSIVCRVFIEGEWPVVSLYNTLVFAIIFTLLARAKGNVSRMFDFESRSHSNAN